MREFKFIRGIYTNENIFNSDETEDCWFACDKNGDDVLFTVQNNEEFQERFAELSSKRLSELYTIRPSQFKAYADKTNDSSYSFRYKLDDRVFNGIELFPVDVKNAIESHLRNNIDATINGTPSLIPPGDTGSLTSVSFTYKNSKNLTRGLYFKVSGKLTKYTLNKADGEVATAYKISTNGEINFNDKVEHRMFISGKLQRLIKPIERTVAIGTITVNDNNFKNLDVESKYDSASGFKFVHNNKLTDNVTYSEIFNSKLYKYVDEYLVQVDENIALIDGTLGQKYVAYIEGSCPNKCYRKNGSNNASYEFSTKNCVQSGDTPPDDWGGYLFYKKMTDGAYVLVGDCSVKNIGDTIVKGYESSYSNLYVISGDSLDLLNEDHLISTNINVYLEKEDEYTIISGGVYKDENEFEYVTLSGESLEDITKDNVIINGEYVRPKQDTNIYREIKNVYINATESLSD